MDEKDVKIILIGESGVGKTSIIRRYHFNKFEENIDPTFTPTFITKTIIRDNIIYRLNIWDTVGQEKYYSITKSSLQGADIVILVYSIDRIDSFKKLDYWNQKIKDNFSDNVILSIVGNKCDLFENDDIQLVPDEDVEKYAKEKNAIFKLVSAKKDNKGINTFFEQLLDEYIKKCLILEKGEKNTSFKTKYKNIKLKKNCC